MRWATIKGIVERVLLVAATYVVSKGYVTEGVATEIVAIILGIGSVIWGIRENSPNQLMTDTAALDVVDTIKTNDRQAAASVTSAKVTASPGAA